MAQGHIFDGFRVLDFTQVLAGPTTTRMMAEMGAEIIKVELAPDGDLSRKLPYFRNGRSGFYIQQNRGKKSVCVNPREPRARELLRALVPHVDVVLENYSPGAIGRLGLDWDTVRTLNPRAVMCSISAFGQTGPLANLPGFDYIAAAYAAVLSMIGDPDEAPYFPLLGLGDVGTGVHAFGAIAAALLHRERTGNGQYVETSLLDSYFHCHEVNVQIYSASGGTFQPTRSGRHHYAVAPVGMFRCKGGYIFLMAQDKDWRALAEMMGQPELGTDPRFVDGPARVRNKDALIATIEEWLADKEAKQAVDLLQSRRIPSAPILSVAEAVNHPHLIERGTVRLIEDPVFGAFQIPGFPLRFSEFPDRLPLEAAYLGQHNEQVLGAHLGMRSTDIRALEEAGVLVAKPDFQGAAAEAR